VVPVLTAAVAVTGPLAVVVIVSAARRAGAAERAHALGRAHRWRLPARLRTRLSRALLDADVAMEPEAACELWLGAAAVVPVLALVSAPALALPALSCVLVGGPVLLLLTRGRARRRFAIELPQALEHVASHLRGGGTVAQAIAVLADGVGPVAADLRRVRARTALGLGITEALAAWPAERDLAEVRAAAGALVVAATLGGRSAAALEGLAASLRDRLVVAAEARSQSAQARLSAIVVGAAPLGFVAFSSVVDPGTVQLLVTTAAGRVCLVLGLGFELLAALWMRRILTSGAPG
jgi:tight adherence protein B